MWVRQRLSWAHTWRRYNVPITKTNYRRAGEIERASNEENVAG